jgi:hypothetical protein
MSVMMALKRLRFERVEGVLLEGKGVSESVSQSRRHHRVLWLVCVMTDERTRNNSLARSGRNDIVYYSMVSLIRLLII